MQTFIPEVWISQLYEDLETGLMLSSPTVTNRRYEGAIQRQGDTVRVPHVLDTVTIGESFNAYDEIGAADRAAHESLTVRIDQVRTFHFEVDSLHQLRTQEGVSLMEELVKQSGRNLAESIDKRVAATVIAAVTAKDLNGTGAANSLHGKVAQLPAPTATNLYETIVDANVELDINNVPTEGRYIIIGPKEYAAILKDERFIDNARYGGSSVVINGQVGTILGLPVIVANTIGSHLDTALPVKKGVRNPHNAAKGIHLMVGHNMAVTFAGQLSELEDYRPEKKFTQAVKGRYYFGTKVIRPEALVIAGSIPTT
ncbi:P22 phage major capsid protein family protein [Streptosporangium canum]|uniref:P22 phage major capsid protein family protein n=1 Tax=Streptosporangium canum TaxID=324952 RepID=UPI0036BD5C94